MLVFGVSSISVPFCARVDALGKAGLGVWDCVCAVSGGLKSPICFHSSLNRRLRLNCWLALLSCGLAETSLLEQSCSFSRAGF